MSCRDVNCHVAYNRAAYKIASKWASRHRLLPPLARRAAVWAVSLRRVSAGAATSGGTLRSRDGGASFEDFGGISAEILIETCWLARRSPSAEGRPAAEMRAAVPPATPDVVRTRGGARRRYGDYRGYARSWLIGDAAAAGTSAAFARQVKKQFRRA